MNNSLILPGSPLIICPELVNRLKAEGIKRYATDAAVFIQQLHYFLKMPDHGRVIDGIKWVYNSLSKWQEAIGWLTDYTFRIIKSKLIELEIIKAQQLGLNDRGRDRSYWYTINYDHEVFTVEVAPFSTDGSSEQSSDANFDINSRPTIEQSSNDLETKTTPKITSENTTTQMEVVALSLRSQEVSESCPVSPEDKTVNESFTKPASIDHSPLISEERINEIETLRVNLTPALRIAALCATEDVYKEAIASFKSAKVENKVKKPTAFLLSALREGWRVPIEQKVLDKQAKFIEWRKASKANDAEAKYSCTNGDRIEISADGKTWITWEES